MPSGVNTNHPDNIDRQSSVDFGSCCKIEAELVRTILVVA